MTKHTILALLVRGALVGAVSTAVLLAVLLWTAEGHGPSQSIAPTAAGPPLQEPPAALRQRGLLFPVPAVSRDRITSTFLDARGGGSRVHHAMDVMAPRHSPVLSVDHGTVERLDTTGAGGIAVYAFDPERRYCYYYAHLDRVADGLSAGQKLERGQVVGFVGTTGNAPASTPHLHFAISEMTTSQDCWRGRPVDPYPLFR